MIEYILADGTPMKVEPENEEQFKLDNPGAQLASAADKQINEADQSQNNQQENTELDHYEYGTDKQLGSYGKTYMPSPTGEGYEWLDTKGQYYKDDTDGTIFHEGLDGKITAFGGEDEYMQHRQLLGLPQDWTGIGKSEGKDTKALDTAKKDSKNKKAKKERSKLESKYQQIWGVTPPENMSLEDLTFNVENPYSKKGPDGEIIKFDDEGQT